MVAKEIYILFLSIIIQFFFMNWLILLNFLFLYCSGLNQCAFLSGTATGCDCRVLVDNKEGCKKDALGNNGMTPTDREFTWLNNTNECIGKNLNRFFLVFILVFFQDSTGIGCKLHPNGTITQLGSWLVPPSVRFKKSQQKNHFFLVLQRVIGFCPRESSDGPRCCSKDACTNCDRSFYSCGASVCRF